MSQILEKLIQKYPELKKCREEVGAAFDILKDSFQAGGKLLICGNGGSASDSEHIVGELMKGYRLRREIMAELRENLERDLQQDGTFLADRLQRALPAISLASHTSLMTAISNDIGAEMVFAQQVYGIGGAGDVLMGISTSGKARNVIYAFQVARTLGLKNVGLTGASSEEMDAVCDVVVHIPRSETYEVQEGHVAVYHAICGMLEEEFFLR
jgi:phosphoheptose isomerase